ncbi:hypothetical protein [Streptomyces sp. NPDC005407]
MRAVTAMLAFLFAFAAITAHLDREVTLQPAPAINHQEPTP